jgi:hypothetical protein
MLANWRRPYVAACLKIDRSTRPSRSTTASISQRVRHERVQQTGQSSSPPCISKLLAFMIIRPHTKQQHTPIGPRTETYTNPPKERTMCRTPCQQHSHYPQPPTPKRETRKLWRQCSETSDGIQGTCRTRELYIPDTQSSGR